MPGWSKETGTSVTHPGARAMQDGRTRQQAGGMEDLPARHEATMVVVRGGAPGKEHALDGAKLEIGRGSDVDLPLDDEEMSSHHAAIEWSGSGFRVCDLGSTNGTFVNGARVQA